MTQGNAPLSQLIAASQSRGLLDLGCGTGSLLVELALNRRDFTASASIPIATRVERRVALHQITASRRACESGSEMPPILDACWMFESVVDSTP